MLTNFSEYCRIVDQKALTTSQLSECPVNDVVYILKVTVLSQ